MLYEAKEPVEQTVTDLNLEEMFEVFDEADKSAETAAAATTSSAVAEEGGGEEDGGPMKKVSELAASGLTYGLYAYIAYLFADSVRLLIIGAAGPPPV